MQATVFKMLIHKCITSILLLTHLNCSFISKLASNEYTPDSETSCLPKLTHTVLAICSPHVCTTENEKLNKHLSCKV